MIPSDTNLKNLSLPVTVLGVVRLSGYIIVLLKFGRDMPSWSFKFFLVFFLRLRIVIYVRRDRVSNSHSSVRLAYLTRAVAQSKCC